MNSDRPSGPVRYGAVLAVLLLGGCSGTISMPWEDALLDPGRIATREPLEIPPDLNELPKEGPRPDNAPVIGWIDPNESEDDESSLDVPFPVPDGSDEEPLSRDEKEQLPDWMESPAEAL